MKPSLCSLSSYFLNIPFLPALPCVISPQGHACAAPGKQSKPSNPHPAVPELQGTACTALAQLTLLLWDTLLIRMDEFPQKFHINQHLRGRMGLAVILTLTPQLLQGDIPENSGVVPAGSQGCSAVLWYLWCRSGSTQGSAFYLEQQNSAIRKGWEVVTQLRHL